MSDFEKTEKQIQAINILKAHKHTALYGGSRSGKTFILLYALIVRAITDQSRHVVLRKTFSSVKRAVWLDTLPKVVKLCFPDLMPSWQGRNKTDYYWSLPNGSEIWMGGLEGGERTDKILGMEFSTIYFNEASELDYESCQTAISRLAQKNKLTKRVFYDFNPPSKRHWSYWLFIKKLDPIDDEPLETSSDYSYLLINPEDNLVNLDSEYLKILEAMPKQKRDRFLKGLFQETDDGLAYYAFDPGKHIGDTFRMPGTLFIGMDFNVDPMTAVIFQMIDDIFYIHDEIYLNNSDTYKMCNELLKRGYIGNIIPDSTGKNRKTSGKSDHRILKDNGFTVMSTRNPFVTDRVNNINRLFTEGRIVINPKCKKLINDLSRVSWKDNKLDQKTDPYLTHISDALGYGLWKLDPIDKRSPDSFQIRKII